MSNVNRGWNPASQKGAWSKLLERFPKTFVEEPPLAHLQIIVALFWKTYELLQILLNCAFSLVHSFFNRTMQKPVFSLRLFSRLSCNSSQTCWNSIHLPTFLDIITDLSKSVCFFQNKFGRWLEKARQKLRVKLSRCTRAISEKIGARSDSFSFTSPNIQPCMLTDVGGNKWKQTTKREHSWCGHDCCITHQDSVRDFPENKSRV